LSQELPKLSWAFAGIWNESLEIRREYEPRVRDHIWASEIGSPFIDRYLKMTGVAPTNGPNARSKRKFQAAEIFEWLVGFVLKRAGIWIDSQEKLEHQYPGLLSVTGKLDHLAGGWPDWAKARENVSAVGLPPLIERASLAIIEKFSELYGNDELRTIVLEVKSLSSRMFQRYEATCQADPRHRAQIFHYLKAKPLEEGHIAYICRDDCRIAEMGVWNPSEAERVYRADIEQMTYYIQHQEEPRKEEEVLFDDMTFRFQTNWGIEYSPYLTKLYGYKEPMEYRDKWIKLVNSMNRVFKRCVTNARMTALNLEVIENAKKYFFTWDELVARAQEAAAKNPAILKLDEEAA